VINVFGLAIRHNLTAVDLKTTIFAYPTGVSDIGYIALGKTMILESAITCPHCGTAKLESMPTDACQFLYTCTACGAMLRPKQGDCCVFCSYGSVPCPPIQAERSSETGGASCCGG
jgi:hypothetical protein